MMAPLSDVALILVNSASGLAFGLSSGILCDDLPWKWTSRHPWLVTLILIALWAPWIALGDATFRRFTNAIVEIYFAILFIRYLRARQRRRDFSLGGDEIQG